MASSDDMMDKECPLCMEQLELDDLNFYPCKCEYQICRFCWHRIRTDENGLCPACRQPYPEDPVNFKPLSAEELQRIKTEKHKQKQQQKQKVSESRKHLANLRVLQKNLVYVVGLSPRVADPDVLKKNEYFGKYGKIHKVVVGSTGNTAQSSSCAAYVTYYRAEDALRAIQSVNNVQVDGRTVKASLGTTKYCSSFLRNQSCHKPECMYLHEVAEFEASFTKEDMQQGKHSEYERRLADQMLHDIHRKPSPRDEHSGEEALPDFEDEMQRQSRRNTPPRHRQTDSMDTLNGGGSYSPKGAEPEGEVAADWSAGLLALAASNHQSLFSHDEMGYNRQTEADTIDSSYQLNGAPLMNGVLGHKNGLLNGGTEEPVVLSSSALTETTQTDWQAAFGFKSVPSSSAPAPPAPPPPLPSFDDDLGFDPFSESSKALSEMLDQERVERERLERQASSSSSAQGSLLLGSSAPWSERQLSPSLWQQRQQQPMGGITPHKSCSLPSDGLLRPMHSIHSLSPQFTTPPPTFQTANNNDFKMYLSHPQSGKCGLDLNGVRVPPVRMPLRAHHPPGMLPRSLSPQAPDPFNLSEWQEGLKALLPNVNVHFAPGLGAQQQPPKQQPGWMARGPPPMPPFTQPPPPLCVGSVPCAPMRPSPPGLDPMGMVPPPFRPCGGPPPLFPGSAWSSVTPPPPPGFSPGQMRP